jgi:hypothetical protein
MGRYNTIRTTGAVALGSTGTVVASTHTILVVCFRLTNSTSLAGEPRSASEGRLQLDGDFLKNEAMSLF